MAETIKKVVEIEVDVDSGDIKQVGKDVEGVGKDLKKAEKGTSGLAGGFKKVGTAIKAAGIGLLIAALGTLVQVFKSNQGAIDAFETGLTALKIAANDLFKFFESNVGTVVDYFNQLFEDPQKKIAELAASISEGLTKRFEQLMETLGLAGKALFQFFSGDFAKAWETAKEAAVQSVDVITGEDGGLEKIVNTAKNVVGAISDYTSETLKSAKATIELGKAAEIAAIQQQGLIEEFDRAAELQRQIRDDETKSFEERIAANEKLGEILQDQIDAETALIDIQQRAIEDRLAKGLIPEFEAKKQLLELDNERAAILAKVTGFESEQLTNRNSLLREQAEFEKDLVDAELDRIKTIEDAEEAARQKKAEEDKKAADAEIALAESVKQSKLELAESTLNALSTLTQIAEENQLVSAKKSFQIQKAISITQATIQGVVAVQKTLSEPALPFPANVIAAAAIGITSAANVAAIAAQKFDAGGGGSAPSAGGGGASTPSAGGGGAPQFNTVGTSGFNQVAGSIANQNQEPIKAYVVANDVTSQQSLDRNSRDKSSF